MIYLGGKPIRAIYRGETPVASVYLGNRQIWQSWVTAAAGAVIVLQSDTLLRAADGVTYTVEAVGGPLARATAEAMPGADGRNAAVWTISVTAKPYMRHIAPMQSAPSPPPLSETVLVLLPSERGEIVSIGEPEQAATITPGQGNDTAAQHTGMGTQCGAPAAGYGDTLRDADCGICTQSVGITGGSGTFLRHLEISDGVHRANVLGGAGSIVDQSHTVAGIQQAGTLDADGALHVAGGVAGGGYDVDGDLADGRLYAAWAAAGAMPGITSMYADADRIAACVPVSSPRSEPEPGCAGIIPASCDHQTPTAAAEPLGSYAGTRQAETSRGVLSVGAAAAPVGAADAPGAALPAVGAICAACMIARVYINPAETAFDAALVSEMDILVLVEIDQMAMYH